MKKFLGRKDKRRSLASSSSSSSISSLAVDRGAREAYSQLQQQQQPPSQYSKSHERSSLAEVDEESEIHSLVTTVSRSEELLPEEIEAEARLLSKNNKNTGSDALLIQNQKKSQQHTLERRKSTSILKSLSSKRSTQNLHQSHPRNVNSAKSVSNGSQSLVDVLFDHELEKVSWLNRFNEDTAEEFKLCRAELKGSTLSIYKPPVEMSDIKCFRHGDKYDQFVSSDDNELRPQTTNTTMMTGITASSTIAPQDEKSKQVQQKQQQQHDIESLADAFKTINGSSSSLLGEDDSSSIQTGSTKEQLDQNLESTTTALSDDVRSLRSKKSMPMANMALGSQLSLATSATAETSSSIKLSYSSTHFPHPDLVIDSSTGMITNGTLESICHAIVFNPYHQFAKSLLKVLPLLDDMSTALAYFSKFCEQFVQVNGDTKQYKYTDDEKGPVLVTNYVDSNMSKRLIMIVEEIKNNFSGMLLDDEILKSVWKLILTIDPHHNCDELKKTVHQKQQNLSYLVNFESPDGTPPSLDQFSAEQFMNCDLSELAREITKINLSFTNVWDAKTDPSLLYEITQQNYQYWRKNPLIFNTSKNIHYLGRLLSYHLFEDPAYSSTPTSRGMILTRWIQLGTHLDKMGDMVSWLAISTTVCSMPILRLTKTWNTIMPNLIKLVSTNWAPVVFELDRRSMVSFASHRSSYHVLAPQGIGKTYPKENVVPYFGDLFIKKSQPMLKVIRQCQRHLDRVSASFKKWDEYLDLITNDESLTMTSDDLKSGGSPELKAKLHVLLSYHSKGDPLTSSDIMDLSLIVEPSYTGQYHNYHDESRSPLFLGSYASILFPQVLDVYRIYDQRSLIGAIGGGELARNVLANTLTQKEGSNRAGRSQFVKNVRDLFNIDSFEYHVDKSIIFKSITYLDDVADIEKQQRKQQQKNSRKSITRSRPSSVLFSENANIKRFSSYSSSSFNLEDYVTAYQSYLKENPATSIANATTTTPPSAPAATVASLSVAEEDETKGLIEPVASVSSSEMTVEILTKSATLDRLIDLLVLTSSLFGSRINESDIKKAASSKESSDSRVSLKMDNGVFTMTFFATYRGFCSTKTLLEGLTRRFVGSKSAAISIVNELQNKSENQSGKKFPDWDSPSLGKYSEVNWKYVAQIQLGILETLLILVSDYYHYFTDDLENKVVFDNLLRITDNETIVQWAKVLKWLEADDSKDDDGEFYRQVKELYDEIVTIYKKMRKIYVKKCYKPQIKISGSELLLSSSALDFTSDISVIPADRLLPKLHDLKGIQTWISQFDKTVESIYKNIEVKDWIDTFEILEVQTAKSPMSLFQYDAQKLKTHEDLLIISNVYSWLSTLLDSDPEAVDTSSKKTTTENEKDSFFVNMFPNSVKSTFQFYFKFKSYLIHQIADTSISFAERSERMAVILLMVQICRIRMKQISLFDNDDMDADVEVDVKVDVDESKAEDKSSELGDETPVKEATIEETIEEEVVSLRVSSLIESCLVDTILSPESRFFAYAWVNASKLLKNMLDVKEEEVPISHYRNLTQLLPTEEAVETKILAESNVQQLSPCPGWIVERLLEISCFIPNMSVENTNLINFDKRRFAYNCISNIVDMVPRTTNETLPRNSDFGFLLDFRIDIVDSKSVYEFASKENKENGAVSRAKIFKDHIDEQIQLLKLEYYKKQALAKREYDRLGKSRQYISTAGSTASAVSSLRSAPQNKFHRRALLSDRERERDRQMSLRSIPSYASSTSLSTQSTAVASTNSASSSRFKLTGLFNKASRPFSMTMNGFNQQIPERTILVRDLPDADVFIDSNTGQVYTTRAKPVLVMNLRDFTIFPIYRTPCGFKLSSSSNPSLEYSFQSTTEKEKDDWIYRLNYAKKHWYMSKQANKNNSTSLVYGVPLEYVCIRESRTIPNVIEKLMSEIEYRGLEEVGIYRKSASLSVLNQIKDQINAKGDFNMEHQLVFDVHNLTGCIKLYLRELPEPLINDEVIPEFEQIRDLVKSEERFPIYKTILSKMPTFNFYLLQRLIRHLKLVDENSDLNKMNASNLATVLGGSFIEGCKPENMRRSFGFMNFICEDMILNYEKIFTSVITEE
ncbi:hypothetical protein CANARDRAFT_27421 [[Candida] arabinofermentans NRRL YB-2248]|uniref:Rho-GAP domain-containing protein n=1 Tax=[Candida] arabinofermentans NRRL YB-2248 TaxID=983967 RepID=A0A1E4T3B4_9ASCO|nr:hypothetical protein CANARDRAFT_27421 [[Candida] arabinofermentans NRRL YB-2248]